MLVVVVVVAPTPKNIYILEKIEFKDSLLYLCT